MEVVRSFLLNKALGPLMNKYERDHHQVCYPVIVGGATVARCIKRNPRTRALVTQSFSKDIDMPFVMAPCATKAAAHQVRMSFLKELEQVLSPFLERHKTPNTIRLRINDIAVYKKTLRVHKLALVTVHLDFYDAQNQKKIASHVLLDCPLYAPWSVEDYGHYERILKQGSSAFGRVPQQKPMARMVPFVRDKSGVLYATCNFVYYDTVRMLLWYKKSMGEASAGSRAHEFAKDKYHRYIAKFMALNLARKEQESLNQSALYERQSALYERQSALYERVKAALANEQPMDEEPLHATDFDEIKGAIARAAGYPGK